MTRWDQFHERFFTHLANLSFDKAKELLEKDGGKCHPDYLIHFHSLVQYERSYHNFGFVPKGNSINNRRERTLCECYSELHVTLLQGQSNSLINDESQELNSLKQLTLGLLTFLTIRTHLMKIYEQISSAVKRNERNVRLEVFLDEMTIISQKSLTPLNIPTLNSILYLIKHEVDCLLLLIQSYVYICDYQYMKAIATLHHMQSVLKEWQENIENQSNANHRFTLASSSPLNIFKSPTKPALYTFYFKFYQLLVAKFSLYFSETLFEYGGPETKSVMTKTNPDFIGRISLFYRRANVECISILLHTKKDQVQSVENPTSVALSDYKPFQICFSYPTKLNLTDECTQNLITKVAINHEMLVTGDRMFYSGDTNQSKTYFLQNIDPRITLALVFASHRQERETTIINFLNETIDLLRCSRQLLSFKSNAK